MLSAPGVVQWQRQQMRALIVAQQFTHRTPNWPENCVGRADRQMCTRANHPPQVIAAAAAVKDRPAS